MIEITCPSGLKVRARKWVLGDQQLLVDPALQRSGQILVAMANAVTKPSKEHGDLGVVDPGPYRFEKLNWPEVAQADLLSFLMQLRAAKDRTFSFSANCIGCRTPMTVEVEAEDLDLHAPMPESGVEHLATEQPFEIEIPFDGGVASVEARLLRARDMPKIARAQRTMKLAEAWEFQKAMHVVSLTVPGLDKVLTDTRDVAEWFASQDEAAMTALEEGVIEREGEPVTEVEVTCQNCYTENVATIPFVVEFFLTRARRRRSSSGRCRM